MAWDGIWRLTDPPMTGAQVAQIQHRALTSFSSYAIPLGVVENGVYDLATSRWVAEYQKRKSDGGYTPKLPANPSAKPGECDFATKAALGIIVVVQPAVQGTKYVSYAFPGTWGTWDLGPQHIAASGDPADVFEQGVQWNTAAFLNPDPQHSYVESRQEGTAEGLRLMLPDHRPKFLCGYSMGADVVVRVLHAWPESRRNEIKGIFTFGSPGRPPGATKLGPDPGGAGISGVYTPDWARDLEWSYTIDGDMYPEAVGLLPFLYDVLTRMEASPEFLAYLFTLITGIPLGFGMGGGGMLGNIGGIFGGPASPQGVPSLIGAQLLGIPGSGLTTGFGALSGLLGLITPGPVDQTKGLVSLAAMIFNLGPIIATLFAAIKFVFTDAHQKYWVDPIFDGLTAEQHAARTLRELAR